MNAVVSRAVAAGAVALALAVPVTGCSKDKPAAGAAPRASATAGTNAAANPNDGTHNAQDVLFASRIGAYQQQAIEMAGIAASRAQSPKVKALAKQIGNEQKAESATVTGRLHSWSDPTPPDADQDTDELPGMLAADDISSLKSQAATEFDFVFLTMMIEHHLGAVTVAKQQAAQGKDAAAVDLARVIEKTHTEQITSMQALLGASGGS
jgi:uncharacterized protein (DUF305 family)